MCSHCMLALRRGPRSSSSLRRWRVSSSTSRQRRCRWSCSSSRHPLACSTRSSLRGRLSNAFGRDGCGSPGATRLRCIRRRSPHSSGLTMQCRSRRSRYRHAGDPIPTCTSIATAIGSHACVIAARATRCLTSARRTRAFSTCLLAAYLHDLPAYAASPEIGATTGERNFVPFVSWMSARGPVVTVACSSPEEAVGVNTPDELERIEAHLRARASR